MAMASKEQIRAGDNRVYLVAGFLFLCIVAGGAFLGMYITLPESQTAVWYPVAGMVLVCMPWFFWLLTFTYSYFSFRIRNSASNNNYYKNNKQQQQHLTKAASTTNSTAEEAVAMEPHEAGRVQFGATTIMGDDDDDQDGHASEMKKGEEESEESSTSSSATDNGQGSFSIQSHESELPLAFSMRS